MMMRFCSKSTSSFILVILLLLCTSSPPATAVSLFPRKVVRIHNAIPSHNPIQPQKSLLVQCISDSGDLGRWTMAENEVREIRFRVNWKYSTVFFCRFEWGSRSREFAVFAARHDLCFGERYVSWKVQTDGFYLRCGESPSAEFRQIYVWE